MTKNNTKTDVDKSLFVFVKDANTGRIKRVAVPSDMQIGTKGNPSELQLLGRFSVASVQHNIDATNNGVVNMSNHDTIVSVTIVNAPSSGRVTVNLPSAPRDGQLHFVKDSSGTATTTPIDITPAPGVLIDADSVKTLSNAYNSMSFYWLIDKWHVLIASTSTAGGQQVPIFSIPVLTGVVTTNTATTGSKESIGAIYFNPTMINVFSGTRAYYWRAIVDSSETHVSASVDLYDINAVVGYPPGIIQNSIMSSSNLTMTQLQVNLTTVLQNVSGSGIFEARLWKTISGSLTSSVSCRNARLEIEYN